MHVTLRIFLKTIESYILMFLGRDLSRENLKKPVPSSSYLRACTSEKRFSMAAPSSNSSSIGPYVFREQDMIGKGFSSRVYKATHSHRENQNYAIKVINLSKFKSSNLAMLQQEIEVHRILNHPNIVKFYDAIKTDQYYYIVTEYCPHGDLHNLLHQSKKLDAKKAEDILCQIINGYAYLLKKGILHRDLKPANIFRSGNMWKIGDFGFSTFCKSDFFFDKLNVGTPLYMPPQSLKTNKYSHKSDIFSLGIILYEMLTGKTPWICKTQKELLLKMSRDKISFSIPIQDKLRAFIQKACEINQYERLSREELTEFLTKNSKQDEQGSTQRSSKAQSQFKKQNEPLLLKSYDETTRMATNVQSKQLQRKMSYKKIKQEISSTQISEESSEGIARHTQRPFSSARKTSNTQVLLKELQFCRLIYYMIKNIKYFPIEDENTRSFLELVLFKHLLRCIKHLEDPGHYFKAELKDFAQYKGQKDFSNLEGEIRNYAQRYEKQYLDTLKNTDILVIRGVNRKFPDLSYTSTLSKKFYEQYYQYLCNVVRTCNHCVTEKLDEASPAQFQALESIYVYTQIIGEKGQISPNENNRQSYMFSLNSKIVMEYHRSRQTLANYKELRCKIKYL